MIPVISIRPGAGAGRSVERARGMGIDLASFPLSELRPLAWTGPDPDDVDALLVGSANAFRHGGEELKRYLAKPVFAVGPATAQAARRHGFAVQMAGDGGLQALLDMVGERPARLLRLAGTRHVPVEPPAGTTIVHREVYTLDMLPMPEDLVSILRGGAVVLLHSAGAAQHLGAECDRMAIDRGRVRLAALGPRIADATGPGWGEVRWVEQPDQAALLALAADMCH